MRLPENVVENNLSEMPPPDNYAGLIYRWTDLINYEIYVSSGKEQEVPIYYLGSHGSDKELTAFVGDGYWHSSKNKDFEKVFSDPNSRLRYEILEYFDLKHDMNQKEHTMLDKVDAKNNPLYYNMNNGIVTSKEPRLSLCQEFLSDVNLQTKGYETTGKYPVVKEKIEDLEYLMAEGHPRIQVRVTDNSHTQSYIKTRIDDAGGDTSKCKPLLVYKDRGGEGVHVLGNGNTTLGAGIDTKHGTDLPVVYISKEVHGKFSDAEFDAGLVNVKPLSDEILIEPLFITLANTLFPNARS